MEREEKEHLYMHTLYCTYCALAGFDPVPGLVSLEHGHLRQDEQAGESEGHCPGHGALPCQMSGWRNSECPGQYCISFFPPVIWLETFEYPGKLYQKIPVCTKNNPADKSFMFHTVCSTDRRLKYISVCTWFSHLSQNTREVYGTEPRECEEEELLDILVIIKL